MSFYIGSSGLNLLTTNTLSGSSTSSGASIDIIYAELIHRIQNASWATDFNGILHIKLENDKITFFNNDEAKIAYIANNGDFHYYRNGADVNMQQQIYDLSASLGVLTSQGASALGLELLNGVWQIVDDSLTATELAQLGVAGGSILSGVADVFTAGANTGSSNTVNQFKALMKIATILAGLIEVNSYELGKFKHMFEITGLTPGYLIEKNCEGVETSNLIFTGDGIIKATSNIWSMNTPVNDYHLVNKLYVDKFISVWDSNIDNTQYGEIRVYNNEIKLIQDKYITTPRKYPPVGFEANGSYEYNLDETQTDYGIGKYELQWSSPSSVENRNADCLFDGLTDDAGGGFYYGSYDINGTFINHCILKDYKHWNVNGEFVKIKMPQSIYISSIKIWASIENYNCRAKDYKIFVSNDGAYWTDIVTITDAVYTDNIHEVSINDLSSPYNHIGITVSKTHGGHALILSEMEIFGNESLTYVEDGFLTSNAVIDLGYATSNAVRDIINSCNLVVSAGENITIEVVDGINIISSIIYTPGDNVAISEDNQISVDLSAYALSADIPDVSAYALSADIPDVSGFALSTDIPDVSGKMDSFNLNENDLMFETTTGKLGFADNMAKVSYLDSYQLSLTEGDNVTISENNVISVDLSGFALSADIPDVSGFALSTDIPDVSGFALSTDIPDVSGFALSTDIPDVSGFALSTDIPDVSGFALSTDIVNYTEGANISISDDNVISATGGGTTYIAGDNVTITGNVISSKDTIVDISDTMHFFNLPWWDRRGILKYTPLYLDAFKYIQLDLNENHLRYENTTGQIEFAHSMAKSSDLDNYQRTLIAGENITIIDNVISSTGSSLNTVTFVPTASPTGDTVSYGPLTIYDNKLTISTIEAPYVEPIIKNNDVAGVPINISGNYYYYQFDVSDPTKESWINFDTDTICDVLMVGGGGSGAPDNGSGGSAGNILYARNVNIPSGLQNIFVGAGGISSDGGNTTAFDCTVYGGKQSSGLNGSSANVPNIKGAIFTSEKIIKDGVAKAGGSGVPLLVTASFESSGADVPKTEVPTTDGSYYYAFTSTGYFTVPNDMNCDIFMIGGGGGGGFDVGGGGGAGAYFRGGSMLNAGSVYKITVGNGGAGASSTTAPQNGGSSKIEKDGESIILKVNGGGAGLGSGGNGGCGGGASGLTGADFGGFAINTGTNGSGNVGGVSLLNFGSGGGGIGGVGCSGGTNYYPPEGSGQGDGGYALAINITGVDVAYGGGGGGSDLHSVDPTPSGFGGGVNIGGTFTRVGGNSTTTNDLLSGGNGVANTGSGGGAGRGGGGGSGSDGIVIIRVSGITANLSGGGGGGIISAGNNSIGSVGGSGGIGYPVSMTNSSYIYSTGGNGASFGISDTASLLKIGDGGNGSINSVVENGGDGTVIIRWKVAPIYSSGEGNTVAVLSDIPSYTNGDNVSITVVEGVNVISATDTTYTAGAGINISGANVISTIDTSGGSPFTDNGDNISYGQVVIYNDQITLPSSILVDYIQPTITHNGVRVNPILISGYYYYYQFNPHASSTISSIRFNSPTVCDILIVAGGGVGAPNIGAGGSAGNLIYATNVTIPSELIYQIVVGAGGTIDNDVGGDGGNTTAFGCTVYGGKKATGLDGSLANIANEIATNSVVSTGTMVSNGVVLAGGTGVTVTTTSYSEPEGITATFTTAPVVGGSTTVTPAVTESSQFYYYAFTQSGSITFPANTVCDILIVGGGGAGSGGVLPAGGGGGEVLYATGVSIPADTYNITVGIGGQNNGDTGGNSLAFNATVKGGGGTSTVIFGASGTTLNGKNGGSGGGGRSTNGSIAGLGGSYGSGVKGDLLISGTLYGNNGGNGVVQQTTNGYRVMSGGGGGAGAVGRSGPTGSSFAVAHGGAGIPINIDGNNYYWGGGGGGGSFLYPGGNGGLGGGGGGGSHRNSSSELVTLDGITAPSDQTPPGGTGGGSAKNAGGNGNGITGTRSASSRPFGGNGGANTGGGGGGSGNTGDSTDFGKGGSGIVIIRVPAKITTTPHKWGGGGGGIGGAGFNADGTTDTVGYGGDGYSTAITGTSYTYSQGGFGAETGEADNTSVTYGSGGDGRIGITGETGGNGTVIIRWSAAPLVTPGVSSVVATIGDIPVYTAGANITIIDNVISTTGGSDGGGTSYTAGTGISISGSVISTIGGDTPVYTAGTGIDISDTNVISTIGGGSSSPFTDNGDNISYGRVSIYNDKITLPTIIITDYIVPSIVFEGISQNPIPVPGVDGYYYYQFNYNTTDRSPSRIIFNSPTICDILIVAGGGSGAEGIGAGGSAGNLIYATGVTIPAGVTYDMGVGLGGDGFDGGSTSAFGCTVNGGLYVPGINGSGANVANIINDNSVIKSGTIVSNKIVFQGGTGTSQLGGGGGGSGGIGGNANSLAGTVGARGIGYSTNITGTNYTYSQGGSGAKTGVADTTSIVNIGSGGDGRIGSTGGEAGGNGTVIIRWSSAPFVTYGAPLNVATIEDMPIYTQGTGIAISDTNEISTDFSVLSFDGSLSRGTGVNINKITGTDTNTTYTAGTGMTLTGTAFINAKPWNTDGDNTTSGNIKSSGGSSTTGGVVTDYINPSATLGNPSVTVATNLIVYNGAEVSTGTNWGDVWQKYTNNNSGTIYGVGIQAITYSAKVLNALWVTGTVNVSSDKRIKYDIHELDDNECLEKIRALKPCKYKYRDIEKQLGQVHKDTIGFISQEVKEVIPDAVENRTRDPEVIPNIQRMCELSSNVLTIFDTHPMTQYYSSNQPIEFIYDYQPSINDVIELRDSNIKHKVTINEIITSNIFNVSYDGDIACSSNLLAFGTYINDFHTLDKNSIYTVGIGAIQEIDRQVISLQEENNTLKQEIFNIKSYLGIL